MRRYFSASATAFFLITFALPLQQASAATTIYCEFTWPENDDLNVKSSWDVHKDISIDRKSLVVKNSRVFVKKNVRTKEYNRLACPWATKECRTKARVRADGGANCNLAHPENTRIDIDVRKDRLRKRMGGRIPNCADLDAKVWCTGDSEMRGILRSR